MLWWLCCGVASTRGPVVQCVQQRCECTSRRYASAAPIGRSLCRRGGPYCCHTSLVHRHCGYTIPAHTEPRCRCVHRHGAAMRGPAACRRRSGAGYDPKRRRQTSCSSTVSPRLAAALFSTALGSRKCGRLAGPARRRTGRTVALADAQDNKPPRERRMWIKQCWTETSVYDKQHQQGSTTTTP